MATLRCTALLLALALWFGPPAEAAEPGNWAWFGSLRSLNVAGAQAPGDTFPAYRLSSTRLRLESFWQGSAEWRLEAAVDDQWLGTDPTGSVPLPDEGVNRCFDLDHTWGEGRSWASRLQIDRLNLGWSAGRLDVTVGRQAIGFGRIVIDSPLDVIAPFPPEALDTDVRPGVDAVRATTYYALDGQLGTVAVFGDKPRHDSYLLTWADNRAGIDLLVLTGSLRRRPMLGFGLAGSLGTLGLKGEAAVYEGERVGQPGGDLHQHMLMSAVEAWYRFDFGLTLIAEYLHNGAGVDDPSKYPTVVQAAPYQEGLTTLLGRHYLLAAPSYELHPLVTLNGLLIWNLEDRSWLLRPQLEVSLADNLSLELFWAHTEGRSPRKLAYPPGFSEIRSEFGSQGDSAGLYLKWYF